MSVCCVYDAVVIAVYVTLYSREFCCCLGCDDVIRASVGVWQTQD